MLKCIKFSEWNVKPTFSALSAKTPYLKEKIINTMTNFQNLRSTWLSLIGHYRSVESHFPKWKSSSISGSCSQVRGKWSGRLTDGSEQRRQWCRHSSGLLWWRERAEPEGKAFNSQVNLCPNPHLWSWAVGSDWKNEITNTNGQNELYLQCGWAQL